MQTGWSQSKPSVYRVAFFNSVHSLDPAFAETHSELLLLSNLTESLLRRDSKSGILKPNAASHLEITENGTRLTFTLRKDLFWSNGQKIEAQDFLHAFRRLLSPSTNSWLRERLLVIKGGAEFSEGAVMDPSQMGLQAPNTETLVIDLVRPSSNFLELLAEPGTAPISRSHLDRFGVSWTEPKNWLGSGPWTLVEKKDRFLVLKKNSFHRTASQIKIEEVHVTLVENAKEGVDLYLGGKLDQFGHRDLPVPSAMILSFGIRSDLLFQPDLRTYFLRINTSKAPLSVLPVREALAMSIDRSLLISSVLLEGEESALSLLPSGIGKYEPPRGYLFSVSRANRNLHDLGYCGKKSNSPNCKPIRIQTLIYPEGKKKQKIVLALQNLLKKNLGIESLQLQELPREEFLKSLREGKYWMALDDVAVLPDRVFSMLDVFRDEPYSLGSLQSQELVRLLEESERSMDWFRKKNLLRQAESMILQEASIIPLFFGTTPLLVSPRVKGFSLNLWDQHPFSDISF